MVEKTMIEDNLIRFLDRVDNIHTTGVAVDDDAYNTGTFKDRDYDLRQYDGFMIKLENLGANPVDYTILSTTKDFENLDIDLVDADFSETEIATTPIATTVKSATYSHIRVVAELTAVKLRCKRTTAGLSSTIRADIRGLVE